MTAYTIILKHLFNFSKLQNSEIPLSTKSQNQKNADENNDDDDDNDDDADDDEDGDDNDCNRIPSALSHTQIIKTPTSHSK